MSIRELPLLVPLGLAVLTLGWLMPGHYVPWTTFQQQWVAAMGGILIGIGMQIDGRQAGDLRWPIISRVAIVLAVVPLIQWLVGQLAFVTDAVFPALYIVAFALSVVCGAVLARRLSGFWTPALMIAIGIGAALSAGIAVSQWLRVGSGLFIVGWPLDGRAFGNLAQPNHLVTLLAMGIAAVLYGYESHRLTGPTTSVLLAWLALGMLTTQSRTAWLFVAVLAVGWWVGRSRARLRTPGWAVAIGTAMFVAGVLVWPVINGAMHLMPADLHERATASGRLTIWRIMIDAILREPWLGYGWNQVTLAQQAAALDNPTQGEMFQNSHNMLLDLWAWIGIPVGTMVAAVVLWWCYRAVRVCHDGRRWALLVAVGAIWMHALLEFPLDYMYFVVPLGLLMGSYESWIDESLPAKASQTLSGKGPWFGFSACVTAMAAMLVWVGIEYMHVETTVRQQRFLLAGISNDDKTEIPPPDVVLIDVPREYHRFWSTPIGPGMDAATLDWMRLVTRRTAAPPAMLRYAMAAGMNGRADEAERTLRLLCKMHPAQRCEEGRESWRAAQKRYEQLKGIPPPEAVLSL